MMIYYVLFVSWLVTAYVVSDAQLHPIKTQDLKSIVDSVKKDVDRHLKMAYSGGMESISPADLPEFSTVVEDTENGKEYRNFMKMMQDSIHHHLVRNLGQPSDAKNGGYMKLSPESMSTLFSTESASELSKDEDLSESSSKIYEIRVGSTKGVPGVHFPDYTDIPITSYTCSEKPYLPGFYADPDTGCQVFHVCWPDRRESFLCPLGTTFNQALRVCDYWYNSNCSLAPYYYSVNAEVEPDLSTTKNESVSSMIKTLLEKTDRGATQKPDSLIYGHATSDSTIPFISQFIPIKAKIVVYPKTATKRLKIVTTASIGDDKKSGFKQKHSQSLYTSKHSRVPRSPKNTKPKLETSTLKLERSMIRFYEALDRAIMDIQNDERVSKLSGHARTVVKYAKLFLNFLFSFKPLEDIIPEPGTELYEHDVFIKEKFEGEREIWKEFLVRIAFGMDTPEETEVKDEVSKDMYEREALNPEPLTNLNPRFIVKPAAEKISQPQMSETPDFVNGGKRSATISNPFKHKDSLNIHPGTKKILTKSYVKLFKTKHKHA